MAAFSISASNLHPALVSRIISYSVGESVEATADPSFERYGLKPYMTVGHL
jgi:hypothetical protein